MSDIQIKEWWEEGWLRSHLRNVEESYSGSDASQEQCQRRRDRAWKRFRLAAVRAAVARTQPQNDCQ